MTSHQRATVVVPVKPWGLAKSRLVVDDEFRRGLARSFALDVLEAAFASPHVGRVVIVTAELSLGSVVRRHGAVVLPDRPMLTPDALNDAIDTARRWAALHRPSSPVLVVPGDLPTLTRDVLDDTIAMMRGWDAAFVPDLRGRGTTLLWASSPRIRTHYGPGSAGLHRRAGMHEVREADLRARCDVDTRADLAEARRLGIGPHTTSVIETFGDGSSRPARAG